MLPSCGQKGDFAKAKSSRLIKTCYFSFGVVEKRFVELQEVARNPSAGFVSAAVSGCFTNLLARKRKRECNCLEVW